MTATDALLIHTGFQRHLLPAHRATTWHAWQATFVEEAEDHGGIPAQVGTAETLVERWHLASQAAETFHADPLVRDVVTAAAATLSEESLLAEDMPATHEFVLVPGQVDSDDALTEDERKAWTSLAKATNKALA